MGNNRNWKAALQAILNEHNGSHGIRKKLVSHSTKSARAHGLFRCFSLLHQLGFHVDPANLGGKHVEKLVEYWTADLQIAPLCAEKGVAMRAIPYSAAYIQQQLSFLRVFPGWINKPGLVREPEFYVCEPATLARTYTAQADKSWAAKGVDARTVVQKVAQIDAYVAAQLDLILHFGLRRKEAIMFCPNAATVPLHAIPTTHRASKQYLAFLRVKKGTKGGRLRFTAIRTPTQQHALDQARRLAPYPHSHLGRPGLTLKQSIDLFVNVMRKAGITKKVLGITPHGLRHQFAGDLYFELTDLPPPVRSVECVTDPEQMRAAYLEVANQLGHNRPQISNAYLGSPVTPRAINNSLDQCKGAA